MILYGSKENYEELHGFFERHLPDKKYMLYEYEWWEILSLDNSRIADIDIDTAEYLLRNCPFDWVKFQLQEVHGYK